MSTSYAHRIFHGHGLNQKANHSFLVYNHRKKAAKDFNINTRASGNPFETITSQRALIIITRLKATKYPGVLIIQACRITICPVRLPDRLHFHLAFVVGEDRDRVEVVQPCAEKDADGAVRHGWFENDAVVEMDVGPRTDRRAVALVVVEVADPSVIPSFCEG